MQIALTRGAKGTTFAPFLSGKQPLGSPRGCSGFCFAHGTRVFTRKMQRVCDKNLYTAHLPEIALFENRRAYQRENNLDICIRLATFVFVNTILQSEVFVSWLARLKDMQAKFRIVARIRRAELGNFGDCKPVGGGVSEMRVHTGQGYRIYFIQDGARVYSSGRW